LDPEILAIRWEMATRNPIDFMRFWVWSNDSHQEPDLGDPVKPFPIERPHLEAFTHLWRNNKLLVIVKCRQVMLTWLFCILNLWLGMFNKGRLIILQSKREEDAIGDSNTGDGLLGRCKFVLNHLPKAYVPKYVSRENRIVFPDHNSTIWALPQGGDIIRQRTCSSIFSDEAGVQEEFAEAYAAAIPTIRGGGRFTVLGTANPGYMQLLAEDRISEEMA